MINNGAAAHQHKSPIQILLADDDSDDRYFFERALKKIQEPSELVTVEDGEILMTYLHANLKNLPHVLFLDQNMPKKNGMECLIEIKQDDHLRQLPVVMYSTSVNEEVADLLYRNYAHYYVLKSDIIELQKNIHHITTLIRENRFERPARENFKLLLR